MKQQRLTIKRGDVSLADLAIAAKTLGLKGERHLSFVRKCLGFGYKRTSRPSNKRGAFEPKLKHRRGEPPMRVTKGHGYLLPPRTPVPPRLPTHSLPTELTRIDSSETSSMPIPEWVEQNESASEVTFPKAPPRTPLLPKQTNIGVLSAAIGTRTAGRRIDMNRLIQHIVQKKPLQSVTRLPAATLSRGVQLLLDRRESMTPFFPDQEELAVSLATVVGTPQIEVFEFMIRPEEATRWTKGGREIAWKPRTGRPVLMATDFGWGDSRDLNEPLTAYDWQRLARSLRQNGCPLISLIPVPPGNWPRWLDQRFTPIHWDPRTRAETIRSLIGPGHAIDR